MTPRTRWTVLAILAVSACGGSDPEEEIPADAGPAADAGADAVDAFVAVHLEAGTGGPGLQALRYQEQGWPGLVRLVAAADARRVKLTLELNPQWAEYALADASRLSILRGFETSGHEIALHHHGASHADWNGYSNRTDPSLKADARYRGTVADMMALLARLPTRAITTGGVSDAETDWPAQVPFQTWTPFPFPAEAGAMLVSAPTPESHAGSAVTRLTYCPFATGSPNQCSLADVEGALASARSGEVVGVVFHSTDHEQRTLAVEQVFDLLRSKARVRTVREILAER